MNSQKLKADAQVTNVEELSDVLGEFDAVIEDFTSPVDKRHFRYDEHLKTVKRRSSASVSDVSDTESGESLHRNSLSFSDERLNFPSSLTPAPPLMSPKSKLGNTKDLEDFIADLDRTLESM